MSAAYGQVADLDDVDAVAAVLQDRQYNAAYALQAFDELSASLRSQNYLLLALVLVTLLAAVLLLAPSAGTPTFACPGATWEC